MLSRFTATNINHPAPHPHHQSTQPASQSPLLLASRSQLPEQAAARLQTPGYHRSLDAQLRLRREHQPRTLQRCIAPSIRTNRGLTDPQPALRTRRGCHTKPQSTPRTANTILLDVQPLARVADLTTNLADQIALKVATRPKPQQRLGLREPIRTMPPCLECLKHR